MKKVIGDERIINDRRKITNEAFSLVMVFLIGSILVQQYVFKASFEEYITEFICFFGASIYIIIRNTMLGNRIVSENTNKNRVIILNSLIVGLVIAVITTYRMMKITPITIEVVPTVLSSFLIGSLSAGISFFIITKLNERKVKKIEKQYNDEEDNID